MFDTIKQLKELEIETGNESINHINQIESKYFECVHGNLKSKTNVKC